MMQEEKLFTNTGDTIDGFFGKDDLYETEKAYREILSLPMHLNVTVEDIKKTCQLIKEFYGTV